MAATTTNVQRLTKNFDDELANELAELDARLLAFEKACSYGDTIITNNSSNPLPPNADPIINLRATVATNNSSSPLLSDAAKPSLPTTPHSEDTASHVTADHLHSDLTIKIGNNDARRNDEHPRPNLDECLHATNSFAAETKHIMISIDKSILISKMENPHPSNTPEIVREVSNSLFVAPTALQPPLLPCPRTPIWPPVSPTAAPPAQASRHLAASTAGATISTSGAPNPLDNASNHRGSTDDPNI
jgi:hypothetical protein